MAIASLSMLYSIHCSALKKEVKRLLAVLLADFGIEEKIMSIYFSGNNGFPIVTSDYSFNMCCGISNLNLSCCVTCRLYPR
jgi:DNA primase catalytic subunit